MNMLFELRTDEAIRRQAVSENERQIHDALIGRGPWQLTERQRRLLECLRGRQGRIQAISIAELVERNGSAPREIKADVRELVINFRLAIVASRDGDTGGYYFATSADERITGSQDYLKEALKLLHRVAILRNDQDMMHWLGQRQIEEGKSV